jgi:hypothetical protein
MFKHHHINLALFDIKLKSPHKDLLFLRGNEFELESIPVEGSVKLSIPEDIHIRKIKLSLIGEYNVQYFERGEHNTITNQVVERLCVLKADWNNLLTSSEGKLVFGGYGDDYIPVNKMESMKSRDRSGATSPEASFHEHNPIDSHKKPHSKPHKSDRPIFLRTKSQPALSASPSQILLPKSGVDGTPFKDVHTSSHHSFLLPKGNYNLPFNIVLPADISETVDSLTSGTVLYKFQCTIERGRFEKPFVSSKCVRICRSLSPYNLNLVDSIDINNTWAGKVQYNVSLVKKGVAIGSTIPISILIVPIAKGLSLKCINGAIVQHFHMNHPGGKSPEWEQIIAKQVMPVPSTTGVDQWLVKTHFKVPGSLKNICQTCSLKNGIIQVKHRLRISIQLKNKEGHISELRANLPIYVYISANSGHVVGRHFDIDPNYGYFVEDEEREDILFKKDRTSSSQVNLSIDNELEGDTSNHHLHRNSSEESLEDIDNDLQEDAPPLYQKHVYDKIYDLNLPQSPLEQLRQQFPIDSPINTPLDSLLNHSGYFDIPRSIDGNIGGTSEGILRSKSNVVVSSALNSTIDLINSANLSNGRVIPVLSASGGFPSQVSPLKSPPLNVDALCKVPTYSEALDNDDDDVVQSELAPLYDDESSPNSSISALDLSNHRTLHGRPLMRKGTMGNFNFTRSASHTPLNRSPVLEASETENSIPSLKISEGSSLFIRQHPHLPKSLFKKK